MMSPLLMPQSGRSSTQRAGALALILILLVWGNTATLASPVDDAMEIVQNPHKIATDAKRAERIFRQILSSNPGHPDAHYNLGLLLLEEGKTDEARRHFDNAVKADAKYAPARARLAHMQWQKGEKTNALETLESIIVTNRYQPEARNILAQIALEEARWSDAITHARNVLLGNPDHANAYINLCLAYVKRGLFDQAWLIARSALDRGVAPAALYNMLGLIYLEKDDSRRASENFIRAIKTDPNQMEAQLNLGAMELAYGDFASALARFETVLEKRPADPMLHLSRGVALRGMKRYKESAAAYEKALGLDGNLVEARYNLCVLHQQYTNQYERARDVCRDFMASIDRTHTKWRETKKRLKSIKATLEVLREPEPDLDPPNAVPGDQ